MSTKNDWENAFKFDNEDNVNNNNRAQEELDKDYYKILGVSKLATKSEIKKSYFKKARKIHPDRHLNEEEKYKKLFQELCEAYTVLSDENKRKIYDKFGVRGLKNNNFFNPLDKKDLDMLFKMAFDEDVISDDDNDNVEKNFISNKPKCKDIIVNETINRLNIKYGKQIKISFKKTVLCTCISCTNSTSVVQKCSKCEGKGFTKDWIPTPGEEIEKVCLECQGKGKTTEHCPCCNGNMKGCSGCNYRGTILGDRCKNCYGTGKKKVSSYFSCSMPSRKHSKCAKCQGSGTFCKWCDNQGYAKMTGNIVMNAKSIEKNGERKIFKGMGNEQKNYRTGDVVVTFTVR